jgi:hypothetical protein
MAQLVEFLVGGPEFNFQYHKINKEQIRPHPIPLCLHLDFICSDPISK